MSLNHILNIIPKSQREELYENLKTFYVDLKSDFESIPQPCTQCGACCDFEKFGHKLYICSLEFAYVTEHQAIKEHSSTCPYLVNHRCLAREHRMLGCRTFFRLHEKKDEESANELYEFYLDKLKEIYKKHNIPWEYRDFMVYLDEIKS